MPKFRKKPVVIEARKLEVGTYFGDWNEVELLHGQFKPAAIIHTLEGKMMADYGDWIISGVEGERYPCKPDIFAQTYELVE